MNYGINTGRIVGLHVIFATSREDAIAQATQRWRSRFEQLAGYWPEPPEIEECVYCKPWRNNGLIQIKERWRISFGQTYLTIRPKPHNDDMRQMLEDIDV